MPKLDLTISISVIVALCAIIAPVLTAIINNCHQTKMKRMEIVHQKYNDTVLYHRNLYENYLRYAGRCIYFADQAALKDYGEYYYSALMYAPHDIQTDMINANRLMAENKYEDASLIIEVIAAKMHTIQQKV